jgi:hypothetical protein
VGSDGQVVVEVLLILPVFLTIVFTIMEIGHLAFWMIVLNHTAYEAARVGALLAGPDPGSGTTGVNIGRARAKAQEICARIFPNAEPTIDCMSGTHAESTFPDSQAGITNQDFVVSAKYSVHLVFPISNILLADHAGSPRKMIEAQVRMPIEQPLKQ